MRKIETLMDITIEDFLKITNLQSTDEAFVRKELIKHFKLEDMNVVDFENFLNELQLILKQDAKFIQRFTLNGIDYGFVPNLDNIKTKEWVDIDLYQADPQNIHRLLSILYRPVKKQKWYHKLLNKDRYEIEEYNGTHNEFLQAPIEVFLGMMVFLSFKDRVISNYQYLYPNTGNSRNKEELFRYSSEAQFAEEFGWYPMIYTAANEDYSKIPIVLESPALEFLTFVNFYIKKQELDNNRIKKIK